MHLEDVPFEACATGSPVLVSYDGDAPAVLPGTLSGKVDLCVAGDTTPIDSTDFSVNLEAATTVVAQLRTATVYATRRSVRVVYQVFDAAGNTRVQPPFVRLHATKEGTCGTKDGPCAQQANCDRPDATSGIGECKLEVRPDFFSSDGDTTASLHLTLNRDELPPFATVSLAKATVGGWAPADNFVVGGALPAHPVYAGAETFDMELLAKSEAPSEEAGLATYQVDVWQVKVTWDPPEALSVERFAPSGSWFSQYTNPANLGDADGAGGVVLLVNEIKNARDANTNGSRLSLGKVTFRANDGFGGQQVAVVVTKQQMVAYSNGIVLGEADVDGPLLDARDGAGATVGLVSVLPTSPVALIAYPSTGAASVGALSDVTGVAATTELKAMRAYDRPEAGLEAESGLECSVVTGSGSVNPGTCVVTASPLDSDGRRGSGDVIVRVRKGARQQSVVLACGRRRRSRSSLRTRRSRLSGPAAAPRRCTSRRASMRASSATGRRGTMRTPRASPASPSPRAARALSRWWVRRRSAARRAPPPSASPRRRRSASALPSPRWRRRRPICWRAR